MVGVAVGQKTQPFADGVEAAEQIVVFLRGELHAEQVTFGEDRAAVFLGEGAQREHEHARRGTDDVAPRAVESRVTSGADAQKIFVNGDARHALLPCAL